MSAITLTDNTLIRFIQRQGTLANLGTVRLSSGELGYATDTKRLFIGDGNKLGGNPAGSKFLGRYASAESAKTIGNPSVNDLYYNTSDGVLYAYNALGTFDKISEISRASIADIDARITANNISERSYTATNYFNRTESDALIKYLISISAIKSEQITDIHLDTRLQNNFLRRSGAASQTVAGDVAFTNAVSITGNLGVKTITSTDLYNGMYNFQYDGVDVRIGRALYMKNFPIWNLTTIGNAGNADQINAEGQRYIRSTTPSNTVGRNGDMWVTI